MQDDNQGSEALKRYVLERLAQTPEFELSAEDFEEKFGINLPSDAELARWATEAGRAFRAEKILRGMRTDPPDVRFYRP